MCGHRLIPSLQNEMAKGWIVLTLAIALVYSSTENGKRKFTLDELLKEVIRQNEHAPGELQQEIELWQSDLNDAVETTEDNAEEEDDDDEIVMKNSGCDIPIEIDEEEEVPEDANDREIHERSEPEPFRTWAVNPDIWSQATKMGYTRPGSASHDDSCDSVGPVPSELRATTFYRPVDNFYQKYTHAFGIPILGSNDVRDEGLKRACYEVKFLFADRYDMRNVYYKLWGRVALIGDHEQQTTLPEYSTWNSNYWDSRARGLGPTLGIPLTSAGDDNMRCHTVDRYSNQDILVHEFAHAVHLMAAQYVLPGFTVKVKEAYLAANLSGLWQGTYAMNNFREYWAIANQMYLNSYRGSEYRVTVNGEERYMRDRETLALVDPTAKQLIDQLYPCQNTYVHRCQWKECTLNNFEVVSENAQRRSGCRKIRTSYSQATLEDCAAYTCSRQGNAFNYRNTYCYALDCEMGDMQMADHSSYHDVYRLRHPPALDLNAELTTPMAMNCARREKRPISGSGSRCDAHTADVCGISETRWTCKDIGCCWIDGVCLYPKQDCVDHDLGCPGKAVKGRCSEANIKELCPLSCGDDECK